MCEVFVACRPAIRCNVVPYTNTHFNPLLCLYIAVSSGDIDVMQVVVTDAQNKKGLCI